MNDIPATKGDIERLRTELKSDINCLQGDIDGLRIEMGGFRGELRELELRIDTKIETSIESAVKQILTAFDMKMDQVRGDMAFADDHETLKNRVHKLEESVFG